MSVDHIRYDLMVRDALRGVVRRVIDDAAKNGLVGDHHFFISFDTRSPGVRLSPRMRAQYPEEMTIVLQHQFWDLAVTEEGFEVGLSFGGVPEKLAVPFSALKGFFDPSVQFGLEFEPAASNSETAPSGDSAASEPPAPIASGNASAPVPQQRAPKATDDSPEESAPTRQDGGAEVVRLDRFRKK
jgi:hypothetical protein